MSAQGLNPPTLFRLDHACKPIVEAFGTPCYLVGSVQERRATANSDVDVRLILSNKKYDRLIKTGKQRTLLDLALGAFLREQTGLPIDFQIQRFTESQALRGQCNPLGVRDLDNWIGDAAPTFKRKATR